MVDAYTYFAGGVLAYVLVLVAVTVVEFARVRQDGTRLEAMVALSFLPEKRRRYLELIAITGSLLQLSAIVWGVSAVGLLSPAWGRLLLPLCLAAAVTALAALTRLGLRPGTISDADREAIRRRAPEIMRSLAFLPISADDRADDGTPDRRW